MSSSDSATFWLIGVPNAASSGSTRSNKNTDKDLMEEAKLTRRQLDMNINKYAKLSDFPIPKLKVGTLDSLMQLSDDLVKIDQQMEAAVLKIARNYTDLKTNDKLLVDEKSPHFYVEGFKWNAAKYPPDSTLQQLVEKIHSELLSMDEDLKKRFSKFAEVQQTLTAIERKETGSLVVRPLGKLINEADIIEREYITSVIVVVPVQREQEFIDTYEVLEDLMAEIQRKREEEQKARDDARAVHDNKSRPAKDAAKEKSKTTQSALSATSGFDEDEHSQPADGSHAEAHDGAKKAETKQEAVVEKKLPCKTVVPRSHKKLYADSEFALYRVMVLRKGKDAFARHCQEKRYTVRTFLHDAKQIEHEEEKKNDLINEKNKLMGELIQYCRTYYSELFVGWMHLKAIRTFVESVLRYGIPVNFQALVLQPVKGYRPKLRKVLQDIYGKLSGSEFAESDGADVGADASGVSEFYPYVYLPINIEEATLEY